eukprot:10648734-Lingulodinium_polyedra.AAC.1
MPRRCISQSASCWQGGAFAWALLQTCCVQSSLVVVLVLAGACSVRGPAQLGVPHSGAGGLMAPVLFLFKWGWRERVPQIRTHEP